MNTMILGLLACSLAWPGGDEPRFDSDFVFPPHDQHNHASSIVEAEDGSLLVSWFRGSGERQSDDVAVFGARKRPGEAWSAAFLMADRPGFPDCNTAMMIDSKSRLWLFWPTILANTWESCLTNYRVSEDYLGPGAPTWSREGLVLLRPDDFQEEANALLDEWLKEFGDALSPQLRAELGSWRERLGDRLHQRLGWQPRCKPTVLPSGRILLPLYTDTYSFSIMAISDDGGETWTAGKPLMGFGNIQPAVLRRDDGTLVAYMRENGPRDHVRVAESSDEGLTWGPVGVTELPNPGSGLDAVRLANGHWVLVYNDSTENRSSLAVSLSRDEGRTWSATRHLERHEAGSYHYPAVIQTRDGMIQVVYSHFTDEGRCIKHAAFNEAWVQEGD